MRIDDDIVATQLREATARRDKLTAEFEATNAECLKVDVVQIAMRCAEVAAGFIRWM